MHGILRGGKYFVEPSSNNFVRGHCQKKIISQIPCQKSKLVAVAYIAEGARTKDSTCPRIDQELWSVVTLSHSLQVTNTEKQRLGREPCWGRGG